MKDLFINLFIKRTPTPKEIEILEILKKAQKSGVKPIIYENGSLSRDGKAYSHFYEKSLLQASKFVSR